MEYRQNNNRPDHGRDKPGRILWSIIPHGHPDVFGHKCSRNPQQCRDNKSTGIPSRHQQLRYNSSDESNNNCSEYMHSLLLLIILKDESFGACEVKYPNGQDKSGTGAKLTHPGSVVPCRASMLSPTNDAGQETADIESLNIALLAYMMWQMAGHPA